jgi:chromosome segregation protein
LRIEALCIAIRNPQSPIRNPFMLKALELAGFKSFADRTRLEFPRGISVIVGPNGSGKSNVVDAVKWVLGSQSAKSLRGKEMIDVIFNGCASRPPLGTAEVTLTIDNADGRLGIDAKEVHVTRRVYRSGEGEYLLNRQPCRLRDIRDLLAGTGITTEAYCIIEQGKVDALLQSSPRDRRIIFEEAAGISQFKAKKASAQRRLERVEQNLLRLSDIVDEVESRLRSVRSQAGKARRYRECTARLQQLRTEIGLVDWHTLTKQIATRELQLVEIRSRLEAHAQQLQQSESQLEALDRRLDAGNLRLREIEAAVATAREQIAAHQGALDSQQARHADLQQEVVRIRRQLATSATGSDGADDQARDVTTELHAAEAELHAAIAERNVVQQRTENAQHELDQARSQLEETIARLAEMQRAATGLNDQLAARQSQLASLMASLEQYRQRRTALEPERDVQAAEVDSCVQTERTLQAQVQSHQNELRMAEERLVRGRSELARVDKQHRQLEVRLTRCRERIAVLTELEQRLEGLEGGVQELLRMAQETTQGPLREVCGVVADLFHVDVDTAHLIEAALGERAQFVVVASGARLFDWLAAQPLQVSGRVGFLRLDARPANSVLDNVDLSAESGVMGRADQFIETAPEYVPLVKRLLGRTWLVDRLSTAMRLSQSAGRGLEFVTSDGELLAADGTLILGPRILAAGIMSRRSELRACNEQAAELERQLDHFAQIHARLDQERAEQESLVSSSVTACREFTEKLADCRHRTTVSRAKLESTIRELQQIQLDASAANERIATLRSEIESASRERAELQLGAAQLDSELNVGRERLANLDQVLIRLRREFVDRQVVAARFEQRVEMLRQQVELVRRNRLERERALVEIRERLATQQAQLAELDATMLLGRQQLAELFLRKDEHAQELAQHAGTDEFIRHERTQKTDEVRQLRQRLEAINSQQHKLEVTANRLRHERQTLCERMQDDYNIDLAVVAGNHPEGTRQGTERREHGAGRHTGDSHGEVNLPPATFDRAAVERDIVQLRDQINNMGAVNLEALDELESLESRFAALSSQYRDLVEAKSSLERIIGRINVDSRQLFLMTLETVRGHFQELFRRLFGGGEASVIVDEAEDVLEGGIEIIARPPGKEACSISLLSGGEKTLTCVALLLAVFRSKPSPFCVLDEVDAALDEANIGRFIGVLREFLSFTQFVVITHSKKTMSGADTLYGVTMEESGVSKRVSVRFEDVSDDGQIRPAVLRSTAAFDDSKAGDSVHPGESRRAA